MWMWEYVYAKMKKCVAGFLRGSWKTCVKISALSVVEGQYQEVKYAVEKAVYPRRCSCSCEMWRM